MNRKGRQRARRVVRLLAGDEYERLARIKVHSSEFGYDPFGLEPESAMLAYALLRFVYEYWFRVESFGVERIPQEGPVLLAPNHSGGIPIDGVMLAVDLAKNMKQPRIMRAVVDNFAGSMPFINLFFYRCGQVIGAKRNLTDLLKQGELITVFPEGHNGTGKSFKDRYKLLPFNVGFVELSLIHRAPIVPAAVIGAEEQYPYLLNIKQVAKILNLPYVPIPLLSLLLGPLGCIPLPTKYQIYYGEPIRFYRDYPADTVGDPETIRKLAGQVRDRVTQLVAEGLGRREGIFGFSPSALQQRLPQTIQKGVASARSLLDRAISRGESLLKKPAHQEPLGAAGEQPPDPVEELARTCTRLESTLQNRTKELETAIAALEREFHETAIPRAASPLPGAQRQHTPSLLDILQKPGSAPPRRAQARSSSPKGSTSPKSGAFPPDPRVHSDHPR